MRLSWDPAVPIKKDIIKENGLIKCALISASQKVIVWTVGEMHCTAIDLQNLHLHSVLQCLALQWSFILKKIPLLLLLFFLFPSVFSDTPSLVPSQRGGRADCCTTGLSGRDFWANSTMDRKYLCCIGCEMDCKTCLELCNCDTKLGNWTCVLISFDLSLWKKKNLKCEKNFNMI